MRVYGLCALAVGALGCIDFDKDLATCEANPSCDRQASDGGVLPDGGGTDAGSGDAGHGWSLVATDMLDYFVALWGTSDQDIWMVGNAASLSRWQGTSLTHIDPNQGSGPDLFGVWGVGANVYIGGNGVGWYWNGGTWNSTPTPNINLEYYGVCGTGPTDVWFVGATNTNGETDHFDGTNVDAGVTGTWLHGCSAAARDAVWAVDSNPDGGSVWRWDGATWTDVLDTSQPLQSVWALDKNHVWVVGGGGLLAAYDGMTWTQTHPDFGGSNPGLWSVWARSPSDVWAVGPGGAASHYDGAIWTPQPADGYDLYGVWGPADGGGVWAVAQQTPQAFTYLLHWQ